MGPKTSGAILDPGFGIAEIPAAFVPQGIKGAVAKKTVETLGILTRVTGKVFTFPILKKTTAHCSPENAVQG